MSFCSSSRCAGTATDPVHKQARMLGLNLLGIYWVLGTGWAGQEDSLGLGTSGRLVLPTLMDASGWGSPEIAALGSPGIL